MPATSEKQATAAKIALAAKKGKIPKSKLKGASKQMAKGMNKKQLKHFTKVEGGCDLKEFVISQNTKVVLDGKVYLLEKGDKIVINEAIQDYAVVDSSGKFHHYMINGKQFRNSIPAQKAIADMLGINEPLTSLETQSAIRLDALKYLKQLKIITPEQEYELIHYGVAL